MAITTAVTATAQEITVSVSSRKTLYNAGANTIYGRRGSTTTGFAGDAAALDALAEFKIAAGKSIAFDQSTGPSLVVACATGLESSLEVSIGGVPFEQTSSSAAEIDAAAEFVGDLDELSTAPNINTLTAGTSSDADALHTHDGKQNVITGLTATGPQINAAAATQQPYNPYQAMADLASLPLAKTGQVALLASSYNRLDMLNGMGSFEDATMWTIGNTAAWNHATIVNGRLILLNADATHEGGLMELSATGNALDCAPINGKTYDVTIKFAKRIVNANFTGKIGWGETNAGNYAALTPANLNADTVTLAIGPVVSAAAGEFRITGRDDYAQPPNNVASVLIIESITVAPRLGAVGDQDIADRSQYESSASSTDHTMISCSGPGVVTRMWRPHACTHAGTVNGALGNEGVEVYVDSTKVIDTTAKDLLADLDYGVAANNQFRSPNTFTRLGGSTSYEPIPFRESLVIKSIGSRGYDYYQVNVLTLPRGTPIGAYSTQLDSADAAYHTASDDALEAIATLAPLDGVQATDMTLSRAADAIIAGGSLTLLETSGSGTVRYVEVDFVDAPPTDAKLDALKFRVTYDNASAASVDVPVSTFFGCGHSRADYDSLAMGSHIAAGGKAYSRWSMPYRRAIKIELVNTGETAIDITSTKVIYVKGAVDADTRYFKASTYSASPAGGTLTWTAADILGQGHLVGVRLHITGTTCTADALEGNETITVDGKRLLVGTGVEDFFNGGFYFNSAWTTFIHNNGWDDHNDTYAPGATPFSGVVNFTAASDMFRWLIPDAIPFESSLKIEWENYAGTAGRTFAGVVFYYHLNQDVVEFNGGVRFPTADPGIAGAWWDNNGTLTRSAG